jgi:hypothetical protein
MMTVLLGFVVLALTAALVTLRTGDLFNPVNLTSIGFFFNLQLARLKLSPLQPPDWAPETEIILLQAWLLWFVLPAAVVLLFPGQPAQRVSASLQRLPPLRGKLLGRCLAVGIAMVYLVENRWVSGSWLPLVEPVVDIHTHYTSGIGIVTTSLGTPACLLMLIYFIKDRRPVDLGLLLLVLSLPLTRLARLDVVFATGAVMVLFYYLSGARWRRLALIAALVFAVMVPALMAVSRYRGSQGNLYEVDSAGAVGLVAEQPTTRVAVHYYRYLALSFDSFDGLVRNTVSSDEHTYGLFTLRPLTLGVLRLHNLYPDYPQSSYLAERADPALEAKVIATGLSYFYLDFGYRWIAISLTLYMALLLLLYYTKGRSILMTSLYALVASAFLLTSFTDLLSNVRLAYGVMTVVAVLAINFQMLRWSPRRGPLVVVR